MKKSSIEHATFSIERVYDATPARVFGAWSNPANKLRWFFCDPDWKITEHAFDFRVGGRERLSVRPPGGALHTMDALYQDIHDGRRIIYTYDMYIASSRISVSLASIELLPESSSTRLIFTEQAAYLDGLSTAKEREEGTRIGLDNLPRFLAEQGLS